MKLTREAATDLLARGTICVLFTLMSMSILSDFVRTGHLTGLMLLASESLVVILTVVRRRARLVDRSVAAIVVTGLSIAGPPMLRAGGVPGLVPDALTVAMSAMGLAVVVAGKIALGRSFGLVPANRGVVVRGPYMLVRHPIYTGYLVTHVAFLVANPTLWNIAVILAADSALIVRAMMEERVLSGDVKYQGYCQRVGWHLVPGVF